MKIGIAAFGGLVCSVVAANFAIVTVGMVPVWFGLRAPAGVYFAGLTFTLRDLVQDRLGPWPALLAILLGALASWLVAPSFAVASVGAFLCSEFADFAFYTPLRKRHRLAAILVSNTVGTLVDSAIFLWLAFGSLEFLVGQVIGKTWVTLVIVAGLWLAKEVGRQRVVRIEHAHQG